MNWLRRLFSRQPELRPEQKAAADELSKIKSDWNQQRERIDPALKEVQRVEKLMRSHR